MALFKQTRYVSDFTQFMQGYQKDNPDVAQGQVEGRALLWDKQLDRNFLKDAESAAVKQKPYVYQPD